jgi:hypothetical protein
MVEDAGFGVVVVNPNLFGAIPFQFFTERRTAGIFGSSIGIAVADTNQTVGDITGRLDFNVAVADGIAAFVITCAPNEVFLTFAVLTGVVIYTAGTRIPTFQRCPVFKGAILGTLPDQVGAEFFLVFGFVARGSPVSRYVRRYKSGRYGCLGHIARLCFQQLSTVLHISQPFISQKIFIFPHFWL